MPISLRKEDRLLNNSFKLYESVRIKNTKITGVVVAVDTDGNTKPPIYFVEKDEEFKTGIPDNDCIWCSSDELEKL